ncbi:MAG: hypothetical protein ACLGG5_04145 [Thermoleophilia bacterium]
MSDAAIRVRELRESYGEHEAVADIDFEVGSAMSSASRFTRLDPLRRVLSSRTSSQP